MKNRFQILNLFALVILIFTLSGCHSSRNLETAQSQANKNAEEWSTLYASVNVTMEKPMAMGFSGRTTMHKDKYIHLSMRFLGMEVAAMYLDTDSAYFVDKYHKYLFAEPLQTILGSKYKNYTLGDIQNILLGQKKFKDSENVKIEPSEFVNTVVGRIASNVTVSAKIPDGDIIGRIDWNPVKAEWNNANRNISFKVPANYQRITLDNLESILKRLSY